MFGVGKNFGPLGSTHYDRYLGERVAVVVYIATSLDGRIADSSGEVSFLDDYQDPGVDYGYEHFIRGIGSIVMGRRTYDQVLSFGDWPYGARPTFIMTTRPLDLQLTTVQRAPSKLRAAIEAATEAAGKRDVWLLGGASIIEQCAALDLIDHWEIFVMPTVLGDGPSLYSGGWTKKLRLVAHQAYSNGALRLVYSSR